SQSAAVPHRNTLWPSPTRQAMPGFYAPGSGEQSPDQVPRETKGVGKGRIMPADRRHPLHSDPLADATTAISRCLSSSREGCSTSISCIKWGNPGTHGLVGGEQRRFADAPFLCPPTRSPPLVAWQAFAVERVNRKALHRRLPPLRGAGK